KLARWILGNPVIAITMIRHDLEAALFAPVELLLVEDENREGVTVVYDLPSSLMVTRENPPLLEAAAALDAKLEDLVTEVTSLSCPRIRSLRVTDDAFRRRSCGRSRPAAIARPALQLIARLRRRSIAGKVWLTATVSFAVARHGHATRNWDTTV